MDREQENLRSALAWCGKTGAADLMLLDLKPGSLAYGEALEVKRSVQRGASLTRW